MQLLSFYCGLILFIVVIECDIALGSPINSNQNSGEKNLFLLGALVFLSFGAAIAGCVCCRRRKKGFEEFTNETGTLNINKTEYPILHLLSAENQHHQQQQADQSTPPIPEGDHDRNFSGALPSYLIDSHPITVRQENIREFNEDDNNNGPISSADMENIENNNAVSYIENQNEIGVAVPRNNESQSSNQENISPEPSPSPLEIYLETENGDLSRQAFIHNQNNSPFLHNQLRSNLSNDNLSFHAENVDHNFEQNIMTNVQDNVPILKENFNSLHNEEIIRGINLNENNYYNTPDEARFQNDKNQFESCLDEINDYETHNKKIDYIENEEIIAIEENESSVEEALRVLDFAIDGEDDYDFAPDSSEQKSGDEDSLRYEHLIHDLLVVNASLGEDITPPTPAEDISLAEIQLEDISLAETDIKSGIVYENEVRLAAVEFVEDILSESTRIVEEKHKNCENIIAELLSTTNNICPEIQTTVSVNYVTIEKLNCSDNLYGPGNKRLKTDIILKDSKEDKNLPIQILANRKENSESLENLFSNDVLPCTSTPSVNSKFAAEKKGKKMKLFEDYIVENEHESLCELLPNNSNGKNSILNEIENATNNGNILLNADATYTNFNTNNTYIATNNANATFDSPQFLQSETFEVNDKIIPQNQNCNETYELNDKTFDYLNAQSSYSNDPCTSKQILERDQFLKPLIKFERDEVTSEELNTITPVNTPIELNFNQETWDKMTKASESDNFKSGWFLHPQQMMLDYCEDKIAYETNEAVNGCREDEEEEEEEDSRNLESTFEALRKHLQEVLPQPQGVPIPDFSENEGESDCNRTFDEYRSPLDGLFGLLEVDQPPQSTTAGLNELIINYKRPLSPIIEESEDETCKTFVLNETKCVDNSTSTGCVDTGEAIMGVTKILMASNDTLFNFEDTLGDRDDLISPRLSSRNDSQATTPIKNLVERTSSMTSIASSGSCTEKADLDEFITNINQDQVHNNSIKYNADGVQSSKIVPPKTLNFNECKELKYEDFYSPDQQKTFSEGATTSSTTTTTASATDQSDTSPATFDNETITLNEENPSCITVIIKDDDRLSETSQPEWIESCDEVITNKKYKKSQQKFQNEDISEAGINSLTDIPSLETNAIDKQFFEDNDDNNEKLETNQSPNSDASLNNIDQHIFSNGDDSGHSTQTSDNKSNNTSDISSQEENKGINNKESDDKPNYVNRYGNGSESCKEFLRNEIQFSSSQMILIAPIQQNDLNHYKENSDPNTVKLIKTIKNSVISSEIDLGEGKLTKIDKDKCALILDKSKNFANTIHHQPKKTDMCLYNLSNQFNNAVLTTSPNNYHIGIKDLIDNSSKDIGLDESINHLSGEEDPWAETIDVQYSEPSGSSDLLNTSSEWDSDDSSEEFMYLRGSTADNVIRFIRNEICSENNEIDKEEIGNHNSDHVLSEDSDYDAEEFIPSSWNASALPIKSAIKSPDKASSSSEEDSKGKNDHRRTVAFKKQRYHSVYEYPKEQISHSILPAYSEPNLWISKNSDFESSEDTIDDLNDGFIVSSSTRPFYGSQFNAFCHTWPGDSDFSWSQLEMGENFDDAKQVHAFSENNLKWHKLYSNEKNDFNDIKFTEKNGRPDSDSGVGESAEMFLDHQSLGELRRNKNKLRLPIEDLSSTDRNSDDGNLKYFPTKAIEKTSNEFCFPNKSNIIQTKCNTDSLDSLSSSSSNSIDPNNRYHDNQSPKLSFITFGKQNQDIITKPNSINDQIQYFKMDERQFQEKELEEEQDQQNYHHHNQQEKFTKTVERENQQQQSQQNNLFDKPATNFILIDEKFDNKKSCSNDIINSSNNICNTNSYNDIVLEKLKINKIDSNVVENNKLNLPDKIHDSADEDSGIESIIKIKNEKF